MLVSDYLVTPRQIPEEQNPQLRHCKNLIIFILEMFVKEITTWKLDSANLT